MNDIKSSRIKSLIPWAIWGLGALFYAYEFFLQVSPSVMVPELMKEFAVTATSLGNLAAFYFYAYATMQIPVGVLLDRYGPRHLLTVACAVCGVGAYIFGNSHSLHSAEGGRLLVGLGSAFAAVGCLSLAARWFPTRRFALLTGLLLTIGMLGATGGDTQLAVLVSKFGWRGSMEKLAFVGFGLSFLIWLVVRDHPDTPPDPEFSAFSSPEHNLLAGLKSICKKKQSWIVAIYGGLMFAPTIAFGGLWGVPYIIRLYDISRLMAGGIVSSLFIGWAVGAPIIGWLSDHIGRRKTPMIVGSISAFILMLCILYLHVPVMMMGGLLFLFGVSSSGFLPAFSIIKEINPVQATGTALGFMNMANTVLGALLEPFIGFMLDLLWKGAKLKGVAVYSVASYKMAMIALPITLAMSILLLPFIKETYCKPSRETL